MVNQGRTRTDAVPGVRIGAPGELDMLPDTLIRFHRPVVHDSEQSKVNVACAEDYHVVRLSHLAALDGERRSGPFHRVGALGPGDLSISDNRDVIVEPDDTDVLFEFR